MAAVAAADSATTAAMAMIGAIKNLTANRLRKGNGRSFTDHNGSRYCGASHALANKKNLSAITAPRRCAIAHELFTNF